MRQGQLCRQPASQAATLAVQPAQYGTAAESSPTPLTTSLTRACLQEFSLHNVWENLPIFLFYTFGISFLGVALGIGIFRPRKQMPVDMFQVGWGGVGWGNFPGVTGQVVVRRWAALFEALHQAALLPS